MRPGRRQLHSPIDDDSISSRPTQTPNAARSLATGSRPSSGGPGSVGFRRFDGVEHVVQRLGILERPRRRELGERGDALVYPSMSSGARPLRESIVTPHIPRGGNRQQDEEMGGSYIRGQHSVRRSTPRWRTATSTHLEMLQVSSRYPGRNIEMLQVSGSLRALHLEMLKRVGALSRSACRDAPSKRIPRAPPHLEMLQVVDPHASGASRDARKAPLPRAPGISRCCWRPQAGLSVGVAVEPFVRGASGIFARRAARPTAATRTCESSWAGGQPGRNARRLARGPPPARWRALRQPPARPASRRARARREAARVPLRPRARQARRAGIRSLALASVSTEFVCSGGPAIDKIAEAGFMEARTALYELAGLAVPSRL